jgi:hypothetical protein
MPERLGWQCSKAEQPVRLGFERDAAGDVPEVVLIQGGRERSARRVD